MTYPDAPLIIPILATGYLLAIYLLLTIVRRSHTWRPPQS